MKFGFKRQPGRVDFRAEPPSLPPLGSLIRSLDRQDANNACAKSQDDQNETITDCVYVASYNWLDRNAPTILIPGPFPQEMATRALPLTQRLQQERQRPGHRSIGNIS